ncbi:50S ribosomal protein L32e [Candidatus Woesearchaeota archaeon]|nr:50S ribosomal protein L32e [Candidatus Woesearchaeota archaeon]
MASTSTKQVNNRLLELRKNIKSKKPDFLRQDAHRVKKLEKNWRRSKGRHSKMRFRLRGYRKSPSIGYSSPFEVRGLNKDGLKEILVNNIKDLDKINDNEAVLLSSSMGLRKRIEVLKKAKEQKLAVSNMKDIDSFINNVESLIKSNKQKRESEKTKKEAKKEEKEKKTEKAENKEEEIKKKVLEQKKSREK